MNFGKFSIKKVETWTAREGVGMNAALYLGNKAVAQFRDDGNGGGPTVDFITRYGNDDYREQREAHQAAITAELERIEWRQQLGQHPVWSQFHPPVEGEVNYIPSSAGLSEKKPENIRLIQAVELLVECLFAAKEEEKDMKKGVLFTDADGNSKISQWGKVTLPTAIKKYGLGRMRQAVMGVVLRIEQGGGTITNKAYLQTLNLLK